MCGYFVTTHYSVNGVSAAGLQQFAAGLQQNIALAKGRFAKESLLNLL